MNTAVKEVQVIKATITGEKTEKIRVAAYCRVSTDKSVGTRNKILFRFDNRR